MSNGIYPRIFKNTKIIPQLKPGKKTTLCESFRPVSNLCVIGKLLEKAVFGQIRRFITETNQINPDHHGGRSQHSTTTCIVEMMEKINEALEAKLKVALLAVDLSAAYDLCQHDIIIQKCRLLSMGKKHFG